MTMNLRLTRINVAVASAIVMSGLLAPAFSFAADGDAADVNDAAPEQVIITGEKKAQATDIAPSQISLDAVQPQSIINQHFIEENALAGSNYADLINLTPSVFSIDPNGSGLMESQSLTIRGFQDGQYNVTFDGIPWGDSNDFTHHSTVYFMPQDMGKIVVDRGPGQASTIGNATFGGTIAMSSKDASSTRDGLVYGSYGSWNTGLLGVQYNSGVMQDAGDSKLYVSVKGLDSDGFLTQSNQERENIFIKYELPLATGTTLTLVSMYNHTIQHVPYGATPAQQAEYGYNFGLVNNNQSESNSDWNYDRLSTDFEYIGLKSMQGNWTFDNKLYTYAYYHQGYNGLNPGSVSLADTIADGGTTNGPDNVPGQHMHNNYRSIGNLFRASDDIGFGKLELGLWMDRQTNSRFLQDIDWTLGGVPYDGESNGGSIQRDMDDTLTTIQPYIQFAWQITPEWTVTPGVKYDSFKRDLDAPINQKTEKAYDGSATWNKALPALDTHYAVTPNLSVYAQYSQGFLAPNLNVFYKTTPDLGSVQPTTTKNYQIGLNTITNNFIFGADVYHIDSTNIASAVACPAGFTSCAVLVPGVTYDGVELEATYKLNSAFSLYGNVAENNYSTSNNSVLQNTPKKNAALGLIYQQGDIYSSLMAKYIGSRDSNTDANGNNLEFGGYAIANFDVTYKMSEVRALGNGNSKISFKISNLLNREGDYSSLNSAANGDPLYFVIPSRSYQVSFSVPF
jgi:iron complex outermembrane receptor protein